MAEKWNEARRDELARWLAEEPEVPWVVIARSFGMHRSSVQREVDRNGGRQGYRAACAQREAVRNRRRPRLRVLAERGPLRDRVTTELKDGRSPEAIWADLVAEEAADVVCVETIYQAVYARVLDVEPTKCLRRRRPRRRKRQGRHDTERPALPNIAQRPKRVNDRSEAGHWEADGIIGAGNRSYMLWLTERVTRFSIPVTMPEGYDKDATFAGLVEGLEQIPAHLRLSITFDQGSEWARWAELVDNYSIKAWFCDPHSPWQRGQVENLNRQWRWWFPRGTDLAGVTPAQAQHAADIINGQRRRSLGYHSPTMLYTALTAH